MNAVEIEEAVTALAAQPFDAAEFPYMFLQAFGNKDTTLKRLRAGSSNKSDIGGVLQTSNIHIAVAPVGAVSSTLSALKASPATTRAKAKFVLATDGDTFEAEDVNSGETVACAYTDFPDHFGFFLPLAGISTVRQIRESSFDIRATSRLNRLYVQLLIDNPDWGSTERRPNRNRNLRRASARRTWKRSRTTHPRPILSGDDERRMLARHAEATPCRYAFPHLCEGSDERGRHAVPIHPFQLAH